MKRRGLSLIELLVAVVILGLALAGLMGLWTFSFGATGHSQTIGVAYNVARREIERQRTVGYLLAPDGTVANGYKLQVVNVGGLQQRTWVVTTPDDPRARFVATATLTTLPDAGGSINATCLRRLHVQVLSTERNEMAFVTTTYFARGGI